MAESGNGKLAVALIAAAGAVGLTWLWLRQQGAPNTYSPQQGGSLQPDTITIHIGGSSPNSGLSQQHALPLTAATTDNSHHDDNVPVSHAPASSVSTAYSEHFIQQASTRIDTGAGQGSFSQLSAVPTDGTLGFGTPNPTLGWGLLSSDDVRVKFPAFLKAAGYLDPALDVLRLNRQGQLTADANWMTWLFHPGAKGRADEWARGVESSMPVTKYSEPFLIRRHVAALYDASVNYVAYKNWQSSGASGILGDWLVSALDPYFSDEFGDVASPRLTPAQLAEGLKRFTFEMSRWMTADLIRWNTWFQSQRDAGDPNLGGDAESLLASSIAKVGSAVAASGGLAVVLAFATTAIAIQQYNDGIMSLSIALEKISNSNSNPVPTPFDVVDQHLSGGLYETYSFFVDAFPVWEYDYVNSEVARAYVKTPAFNAICKTYLGAYNQISGGTPATSFNWYFTGLTRSRPMNWSSG